MVSVPNCVADVLLVEALRKKQKRIRVVGKMQEIDKRAKARQKKKT